MSSPSLPGQVPADDGAAAEENDLQASLMALSRLSTGRLDLEDLLVQVAHRLSGRSTPSSWRGLFLIGALPLVTLLPLAIYRLPESVSWLVAKGQIDKARAVSRRTGLPMPDSVPHQVKAERVGFGPPVWTSNDDGKGSVRVNAQRRHLFGIGAAVALTRTR